jgi:cystathionine beta-lyase
VTIISPAKSFNVPGLSSSVVIIPSETQRARFSQIAEAVHVGQGNIFGTIAIEQAFTHGDQWIDQLNEYIGGNIDFVLKFLAEKIPSVKCYRPEAMYLMWLDFSAWGMTHNELCDFMLKEARIGTTEGRFFGIEGEGCMRINVAAPRVTIEKAMNQLYEASLKLKNL